MSFINAFFLAALGAMVLPVLFHFVRKARARKEPFGSLMFLAATRKELIKKRRLRDVLLMAVRASILGLLALAFARPFLPTDMLPFVSRADNESVVILLDNSYSMRANDNFEKAKTEALAFLDDADADDQYAVVLFSDAARALTTFETSREAQRQVIAAAASPSNRGTDYYEPLRLADELLRDAKHEQRKVVLISDFQHHGWSGAIENWKLPSGILFEPVKMPAENPSNATIEAFEVQLRRTGAQVAVRLDARVRAYGVASTIENTASLTIDGADAGSRNVPALETSRVSFQQIAPYEGIFQGHIALGPDDLDVDNRHYFTYAVRRKPSVAVVDGGGRGTLRDAYFLEKTFSLGDASPYAFTNETRQQLTRSGLAEHSVVFIANVPSLTTTEISALRSFMENGGHVVVSFGRRSNVSALSENLSSLGAGRLDGVVVPRSVQGTDAIIGEVDLRHPIFAAFASAGRSAILRPKFNRYVRIVPDSSAAVIGSFDTGDPFLIERRVGSGRLLVYASTLNTRWTNFPINELYVPFAYQIVKHAVASTNARHMYRVGDVIALGGRSGAEWDIRTPSGELRKVAVDEAGNGFFRDTDDPGHYMAARGGVQFAFSVNVDPEESDLSSRDEEEVYAAVVAPAADRVESPATASLIAESEEKNQKLWRWVLLLAISLFALETFLANRPARHGPNGTSGN